MYTLTIGDSIRRLRREKNVTQERLAEHLHISTQAVSKWERNETLPDITMLLPLATFFGVTTDELLGADQERREAEIQAALDAYWQKNGEGLVGEADAIMREALERYPDDFRLLHRYMWCLAGGGTDNDERLLAHHDELLNISIRIMESCTDDAIRRGAMEMRAKLCKVDGNLAGAMEILNRFPTWYGETRGQKAEQLYAKQTDGWWYWLHRNIFDLTEFAADKIGKAIWYGEGTFGERYARAMELAEVLLALVEKTGYKLGYRHVALVYSTAAGWAVRAGEGDTAVDCYRQYLTWAARFDAFRQSEEKLPTVPVEIYKDVLEGWMGTGETMVSHMLPWLRSTPFLAGLREREDFMGLLAEFGE